MDYRQTANEKKYDFASSSYNFIASIISLGQANKIYRKIADKIDQESKSIVEIGCGPASVIPSIVKNTDSYIKIVGIDFSAKMIEIANRKKQVNNWDNVEFICMDMYDFKYSKPFDAVIFCLALTAIPNSTKALKKALTLLRPGGQLIIIDSIPLNNRWWHQVTNTYIYLKSLVVGARPTKKILSFIHQNMVDVEVEEMAFGIYTVINARKLKSA